ncbi:nicotinate phosphoribosyltransferase [uncultured Draconibacterium sp.]|uniref:nicotinate phosphoribosyltransferase n=1 Tax=uncultured Draconibacterium sp. TaxID=1573823 RepID=UPI0032617F82
MGSIFKEKLGLYTDLYELTMAQGYFLCGKKDQQTSFDYYFRTNPYQGGFTVFAGLQDFLDALQEFTYTESDLEFLQANGFKSEFLNYLRKFKFSGNITSVREGEIVFPNEPLLSVEGNIIECQLLESMLLNILNFESLIATKAFRIKLISGEKLFADFGLRRAQGLSSLFASRAACIGGASSTSNALAGKIYDIPVSGTMAHSWVQSFSSELEAFRAFAATNPNNAILLVDTYDTLKSGIPNAITVGHEMATRGEQLKAIRLDSGDLAYLSKKARKLLDDAGLSHVKILASNQLNEYVIKTLLNDQQAAIDGFGIGTELITGKNDAALDGVYKLTEIDGEPKMKFSENVEKITLPGKKQLLRYFDNEGKFYRDGIMLADESPLDANTLHHRIHPEKQTNTEGLKCERLHEKVVHNGRILLKSQNPILLHAYLQSRAALLPEEHQRFISPHLYKVGISNKLMTTRNALTQKLRTLH